MFRVGLLTMNKIDTAKWFIIKDMDPTDPIELLELLLVLVGE